MFLITGVTGNTGSVVAQSLLDAGKKIRVVVRSEEKGASWKEKGADVIVADLFDHQAMTNAMQGVEAAYLMLPPDVVHEDFIGSRKQIADVLAAASEAANIPHVVFLSSVGAHHIENTGPIVTLSYLESLFEKSTIKSTAIRPGYFLENWLSVLEAVRHQNVLPSFLHPLDLKIDMVATQDIGETAADALLNPSDDQHRVIELTGASQYSANDVAAAFSKALGKDITPIAVPQEAWVPTLTEHGLSQSYATALEEMYANINNGFIDYTGTNTQNGKVALDDFVQKIVA